MTLLLTILFFFIACYLMMNLDMVFDLIGNMIVIGGWVSIIYLCYSLAGGVVG